MTVDSRQIIEEYLTTLEGELGELSSSDRAEIILEVREHFDEARRALSEPTEADLRNILERLGAPAEIALEARQRLGVASRVTAPNLHAASTAPSGQRRQRVFLRWQHWSGGLSGCRLGFS